LSRSLPLLLLAACGLPALGQGDEPLNASGGELRADQACFDVRHYDLQLAIDPEARTIEGRLIMTADVTAPSRRLALDLDNRLVISAITIDGVSASWEHSDGRVVVTDLDLVPGTSLSLSVSYGGQPREAPNPPWDGGFTWASSADGRAWIATSCQGEGADLWWPCKDHPSDKPDGMDLTFDVPAELVVASNGVLVSDELIAPDTRRFHWRVSQPISNYCVALNIGPYVTLSSTVEGVDGHDFPFVFYVLPENVEAARAAMPEFIDHLRFFERTIGPYPFRAEKYGLVETPHLGMEHQTIIAYGNRYRQSSDFDYDWLHHHEASHEWWANLVTCADWKDMWIHEGFGTYMQALYIEQRFGRPAYRTKMSATRAGLNNRRPVAPRETQDSKQIYFGPDGGHDNDIYDKGSFVLHTLRWTLGDEAFFEGLSLVAYPTPAHRAATDGSQVRLVDTEDVRALFEQSAGRDLGRFFEVYLRQPGLPELAITRTDNALQLRWITPDGGPLAVPVPVTIDGRNLRVAMPGGSGQVALPGDANAEVEILIDPEGWLLRADADS
jgi:aminopeptidase N